MFQEIPSEMNGMKFWSGCEGLFSGFVWIVAVTASQMQTSLPEKDAFLWVSTVSDDMHGCRGSNLFC